MVSKPLVSIAIPAYNHAAFIEACLGSVCAQTYPELELVLIDDGSTDDTYGLAKRFLERHRERFRRIVLERGHNQGVSANSNACIEACHGEWVHLLGSDDVLCPDKVERIQQAIGEWHCERLALVHADCSYIGEEGEPVSRARMKSRPAPGPDFHSYRWIFSGDHYIFNPTIALHRRTFLANGGFDRTLPLEDLDCWLRLSVNHAIARVPETLARYRKHPGNASRRRVKMLAAQFRTYSKFLSENAGLIDDKALMRHYRESAWRFWHRIRRAKPWLFPVIVASLVQSYWNTPSAVNYARLAAILESISSGSKVPCCNK